MNHDESRARAQAKEGRTIQHDYHDHAFALDSESGVAAMDQPTFSRGGSSNPPFPVRLHYVLDELNKDGLSGE